MLTNTYLPHVGGVARSVETFRRAYRRRGHKVLVVAPEFEDRPADETGVLRVPAIQNFSGSDFSYSLPSPVRLLRALREFAPDLLHAHHPFLLGDTALRLSARLDVPLVFTHHTRYEHYTHYLPGDSEALKHMAIQLATSFCNLCDHVVAPSASIAALLRERGVRAPVTAIPTGIALSEFRRGAGGRFRRQHAIPRDAFVIGHVGRLAEEKNGPFLMRALRESLRRRDDLLAVIVGDGDERAAMEAAAADAGLADRFRFVGEQTGKALADAYHAMDVFAFASLTETQGMVLAEAMAAGVPVVALDAPGARDIVADRRNGRLLGDVDEARFAEALIDFAELPSDRRRSLCAQARRTAASFSSRRCVSRMLTLYKGVREHHAQAHARRTEDWSTLMPRVTQEWEIWRRRLSAVGSAIQEYGFHVDGDSGVTTPDDG